jgi:hypothetical protein
MARDPAHALRIARAHGLTVTRHAIAVPAQPRTNKPTTSQTT